MLPVWLIVPSLTKVLSQWYWGSPACVSLKKGMPHTGLKCVAFYIYIYFYIFYIYFYLLIFSIVWNMLQILYERSKNNLLIYQQSHLPEWISKTSKPFSSKMIPHCQNDKHRIASQIINQNWIWETSCRLSTVNHPFLRIIFSWRLKIGWFIPFWNYFLFQYNTTLFSATSFEQYWESRIRIKSVPAEEKNKSGDRRRHFPSEI